MLHQSLVLALALALFVTANDSAISSAPPTQHTHTHMRKANEPPVAPFHQPTTIPALDHAADASPRHTSIIPAAKRSSMKDQSNDVLPENNGLIDRPAPGDFQVENVADRAATLGKRGWYSPYGEYYYDPYYGGYPYYGGSVLDLDLGLGLHL
ncbi:hypothetical protein H4R99_001261 [Coemansia sp. RSA 1722]|nr:hypothetical protein LPJ57_000657 [Coemansia sp. RSA 486]KAJ2236538.1 hypothetical protein IWW45_001706 [Coemansia sp. RSA 485]KAJ2600410.1 hypothetical protein GGF39_001791 [Coemansia sp. RSA 1721]KAJ2605281.1 hypothetical protein H4R99_001261 [Coemansia sp. RSA 1722]KAJ2639287.1 hypothetical protein GGF40_000952 [Coemansia sp. RSA 1286]